MSLRPITHLTELTSSYDIILSDVWGVVHDGVSVYPEAQKAFQQAQTEGKTIILITNSPRRSQNVIEQLKSFGMPPEAYDGIVTSGDVTRKLITQAPKKIFHIGPDKDLGLYEGLDCQLVDEDAAEAIVCTGLFNQYNGDKPENYQALLEKFKQRDLPFICANPDTIVHIGGKELWCAGALAKIYNDLGGKTMISGKPFSPIYNSAFNKAAEKRNLSTSQYFDKKRVLVIGDGISTDIKGASDQGLDCLFIAGGIHIHDYSNNGLIDQHKLEQFMHHHGYSPVAYMPLLK